MLLYITSKQSIASDDSLVKIKVNFHFEYFQISVKKKIK